MSDDLPFKKQKSENNLPIMLSGKRRNSEIDMSKVEAPNLEEFLARPMEYRPRLEFLSSTLVEEETVLTHCVKTQNEAAVESLLRAGADPNLPSKKGVAPISAASHKGNIYLMNLLIAAGAKVNALNSTGSTALIQAAHFGHLEAVQLLLANNAASDLSNVKGTTALMRASQEGHVAIARCLIASGVDVNRKNHEGMNALMLASQRGHADIVYVLVKAGAAMDEQTSQGSTALMLACKRGHESCAEVLVSMGAEIFIRDKRFRTARDTATRRNHYGLLVWLDTQVQVARIQEGRHKQRAEQLLEMRAAHLEGRLRINSAVECAGSLFQAVKHTKQAATAGDAKPQGQDEDHIQEAVLPCSKNISLTTLLADKKLLKQFFSESMSLGADRVSTATTGQIAADGLAASRSSHPSTNSLSKGMEKVGLISAANSNSNNNSPAPIEPLFSSAYTAAETVDTQAPALIKLENMKLEQTSDGGVVVKSFGVKSEHGVSEEGLCLPIVSSSPEDAVKLLGEFVDIEARRNAVAEAMPVYRTSGRLAKRVGGYSDWQWPLLLQRCMGLPSGLFEQIIDYLPLPRVWQWSLLRLKRRCKLAPRQAVLDLSILMDEILRDSVVFADKDQSNLLIKLSRTPQIHDYLTNDLCMPESLLDSLCTYADAQSLLMRSSDNEVVFKAAFARQMLDAAVSLYRWHRARTNVLKALGMLNSNSLRSAGALSGLAGLLSLRISSTGAVGAPGSDYSRGQGKGAGASCGAGAGGGLGLLHGEDEDEDDGELMEVTDAGAEEEEEEEDFEEGAEFAMAGHTHLHPHAPAHPQQAQGIADIDLDHHLHPHPHQHHHPHQHPQVAVENESVGIPAADDDEGDDAVGMLDLDDSDFEGDDNVAVTTTTAGVAASGLTTTTAAGPTTGTAGPVSSANGGMQY